MKRISALFLIICMALSLYSCSLNSITGTIASYSNSEDYPKIFNDKYKLNISENSKGVFPDNISSSTASQFDFYYRDTLLFTDYTVYLKCKYSESDYLAEKERVSTLSAKVLDKSTDTENIYEDKDNFIFDAYVMAAYIDDGRYHYALFDGENNEVIYVDLSQQFDNSMIRFDRKYLPDYFCQTELNNEYNYNLLLGIAKR